MKKFDIVKAIKHNDQLVICEGGSGLTVRFEKINFVKQTSNKQMVFTTEADAKVVLKADEFDASEYNPCGKHSDCWIRLMSDAEDDKYYYECGSIAF